MSHFATPPDLLFPWYVRLLLANQRRRYGREFEASPLFDECIKAAFTYAAAVTKNKINTNLMARLKKHFNEDAIIELTALTAFQNPLSKFNSALDVVRGFCNTPLTSNIRAENLV